MTEPVAVAEEAAPLAAASAPVFQTRTVSFEGRDGAGPCKAAKTAVGDKVLYVFLIGEHSVKSAEGGFETTVTVAGEIQQQSARNLSGNSYLAVLQVT